jgi:CRP/FNR family cyclic AMP-dependent transcriptional regulator
MISKDTLAGLGLFEGLDAGAVEAIAKFTKEATYAEGATIFSPEQPSDFVYLLLDGSVRLTVVSSPLTHPVTLAVLKIRGQLFGFSSVLGQGHHNSSAEAATAARVAAIEAQPLLDYLEKNPKVGSVIMKRVAQAVSRRLAAIRRLLLETVIDFETQASTIVEN